MIIGYARTSTTDQTAGLAAQARDLTAAGAERIFAEQVSSVVSRAKLTECLAFLREGDGPSRDQAGPAGTADDRGGPVQARHRSGGIASAALRWSRPF
jgi:Resolvase, N terminal domain